MISVITVNWNSFDFLELLLESVERYSDFRRFPHDVIVVDNSEMPRKIDYPHVHHFPLAANIGHGRGLNFGVAQSYISFPENQYIMFLDVDCHILCHGWETYFIDAMNEFDIVGGRGVMSKPIRPACMFMKKHIADHDWSENLGYRGNRNTPEGYDVAIRAFHQLVAGNYKIGFLETIKNRYGTMNGEEYTINGMPLVYHHWHGSTLHLRQPDFPDINLLEDKDKLLSKIPWRIP